MFLKIVCILVIFRISKEYLIENINAIYGPTEW